MIVIIKFNNIKPNKYFTLTINAGEILSISSNENSKGIAATIMTTDIIIFATSTDEKYLRYAMRRVKNYPIRRVFFKIKAKAYAIARRILKGKK